MPEGQIDPHQRLLLLFGQIAVAEDVAAEIGVSIGLLEDAGLDVEGLGRDTQRLGDLLENLRGRASQPPLDLTQIRVRDPGQFGESSQRQPGASSLLANERTELVQPIR